MLKKLTFKTDVARAGRTLDFTPKEYAEKFVSYLNQRDNGGFCPFNYFNYRTSKFIIDSSEVRKDEGELVALIEGVENLENRGSGLSGYEKGVISYEDDYISDEEILELTKIGKLKEDNVRIRNIKEIKHFKDTFRSNFLANR